MGSIGFVWRELSDSDLAFGTVEETEEPEVSAETAGLYFKRLEYFNFGSVLHNVLIFNISRTSGAPSAVAVQSRSDDFSVSKGADTWWPRKVPKGGAV